MSLVVTLSDAHCREAPCQRLLAFLKFKNEAPLLIAAGESIDRPSDVSLNLVDAELARLERTSVYTLCREQCSKLYRDGVLILENVTIKLLPHNDHLVHAFTPTPELV